MRNNRSMEEELLDLLGPDAFLVFVEAFGGARLYVAKGAESQIAEAIGPELAAKLALRFGGEYPRIPLARTFRAKQYRAAGLSNPQIGRRLGMTDKGVELIFERAPTPRPRRTRERDARQIDLFD